MEVKIIKSEKEHLIIEMNNQTIAELVRVYLNKDSSVEMAVWRRDHPDDPIVLEIKTKGKTAKKALDDAVSTIEKESNKYVEEFKKSK